MYITHTHIYIYVCVCAPWGVVTVSQHHFWPGVETVSQHHFLTAVTTLAIPGSAVTVSTLRRKPWVHKPGSISQLPWGSTGVSTCVPSLPVSVITLSVSLLLPASLAPFLGHLTRDLRLVSTSVASTWATGFT